MTTQNYLIVESNVVTNNVVWDGNTETWTPPANATMLVEATTPAMIWEPIIVDSKITDWVLTEEIGAGSIGFTWNGTVLTTNEPKPSITE
jgi:hypothetical protein